MSRRPHVQAKRARQKRARRDRKRLVERARLENSAAEHGLILASRQELEQLDRGADVLPGGPVDLAKFGRPR